MCVWTPTRNCIAKPLTSSLLRKVGAVVGMMLGSYILARTGSWRPVFLLPAPVTNYWTRISSRIFVRIVCLVDHTPAFAFSMHHVCDTKVLLATAVLAYVALPQDSNQTSGPSSIRGSGGNSSDGGGADDGEVSIDSTVVVIVADDGISHSRGHGEDYNSSNGKLVAAAGEESACGKASGNSPSVGDLNSGGTKAPATATSKVTPTAKPAVGEATGNAKARAKAKLGLMDVLRMRDVLVGVVRDPEAGLCCVHS